MIHLPMIKLSKDVIGLIMLELDIEDLYNFCVINNKIYRLMNEVFWNNKIEKDFSDVLDVDESKIKGEKGYRMIYDLLDLQIELKQKQNQNYSLNELFKTHKQKKLMLLDGIKYPEPFYKDNYKGYNWRMKRIKTFLGGKRPQWYWCGYVDSGALSEDDWNLVGSEFNGHITYGDVDDETIGFDCAHSWDYPFGNSKSVYKDYEFVLNCIKNAIDVLVKLKNEK